LFSFPSRGGVEIKDIGLEDQIPAHADIESRGPRWLQIISGKQLRESLAGTAIIVKRRRGGGASHRTVVRHPDRE
jgi:hypothetical protein